VYNDYASAQSLLHKIINKSENGPTENVVPISNLLNFSGRMKSDRINLFYFIEVNN